MKTSTSKRMNRIKWTGYDLALLSHTHQQAQVKTNSVAPASASVSFIIHKGKPEFLKYNTKNTNPITYDGETVEEVESLTYLVNIIDEREGSDSDVKARTENARKAFLQLKDIWN
ncbi:unnamed protein product [Schistosoma margrebowiei]|uniref:Uncharacterized protein n=1 Tax=Schistosoma margrebowiei TaxID=48269 RepID=A0A183N811_9TREM|nr:unnamed protein product [Schistosoma margrebowiei]